MKRILPLARRSLLALFFIGTLVLGTTVIHQRAAEGRTQDITGAAAIPVTSARIQIIDHYQVFEHFVGRLEPAQRADTSFEHGGLITDIFTDEGQHVEKGAIIARLDIQILQTELDRLHGQLQHVTAQVELARLTEQRQINLQVKGHVSDQRADEARLKTKAFDGQRIALLASVHRIELDLEKSLLRAPFSGIVGRRHVDVGTVVQGGTPVLEILETSAPRARIGIAPEAAKALHIGQQIDLSADGSSLAGRISAIRLDMSTQTRSVSVLVDLEARKNVQFGNTIRFRLARDIPETGAWLQISALSEGYKGTWTTLTLKPTDTDGQYQVGQEAVEIIHTNGQQAFVRGTLTDGQRIITSGRNRVIPGQTVSLAETE
ncbi:efflux RND transporter periplasmic adaptor subunit [Parasedimentitalea marina]|uniref:Efflux RND transporter periplasmic adaptor subunit n=1 Tax=Parasedimentitalea marina TaxID=2483033 RepID=A0A3T0MZ38_9RHOB|nr:efflux RND transporter periplasmic adaptor subunit [Parasedimentitalea marina]AZV77034.1 efflux RND transporter periplasmic adaptor subunit [Parasedimentitalea marina]